MILRTSSTSPPVSNFTHAILRQLQYMQNECVSSLAPMKDITHRVPDKNQAAYARENGIDGDKLCMIASDFNILTSTATREEHNLLYCIPNNLSKNL
jgi:hypothetical protein